MPGLCPLNFSNPFFNTSSSEHEHVLPNIEELIYFVFGELVDKVDTPESLDDCCLDCVGLAKYVGDPGHILVVITGLTDCALGENCFLEAPGHTVSLLGDDEADKRVLGGVGGNDSLLAAPGVVFDFGIADCLPEESFEESIDDPYIEEISSLLGTCDLAGYL